MNSFVEGAKYFVLSANGLHCEKPFLEESMACRHSNTVPYWLVFKPKCVLYHSLTCFGSLHLKKIPPMPVTLFSSVLSPELFVMIALKAKPRQKDVAKAINSKVMFFIVGCFLES